MPANQPDRAVARALEASSCPARGGIRGGVLAVHTGQLDEQIQEPVDLVGRREVLRFLERDVGEVTDLRIRAPRAAAEHLGRRCDDRVEPEERVRGPEGSGKVARPNDARDLIRSTAVRVGPAEPDRRQAGLRADVATELQGIQGGDRVARPDRPWHRPSRR